MKNNNCEEKLYCNNDSFCKHIVRFLNCLKIKSYFNMSKIPIKMITNKTINNEVFFLNRTEIKIKRFEL